MSRRTWLGALLALSVPVSAEAQPRLRNLEVAADARWGHGLTGLVLPPTLAELPRVGLSDTGSEELDIVATYESPDQQLTATLYLFRPQIPSVPLWFDRAKTVFEQMKRFPIAASGTLPVRGFALGGRSAPEGLSIAYPLSGGGYRSTAIAVARMNGWIVKIRMSSKSLEAAALEAKLAAFAGGILLPKTVGAAQAAAELPPCPAPLSLEQAKVVKPDMAQTLIGSLVAAAASSKAKSEPVNFCKEAPGSVSYGLYRANASTTSYVMALADSGRSITMGSMPNLLDEKKPASYSVSLMDLGRTLVFPSLDRLPQPDQVVKMLGSSQPVSSVKVGTTTVEISPGQMRN